MTRAWKTWPTWTVQMEAPSFFGSTHHRSITVMVATPEAAIRYARSLRLRRDGGRYVVVGVASGPRVHLLPLRSAKIAAPKKRRVRS